MRNAGLEFPMVGFQAEHSYQLSNRYSVNRRSAIGNRQWNLPLAREHADRS